MHFSGRSGLFESSTLVLFCVFCCSFGLFACLFIPHLVSKDLRQFIKTIRIVKW